MQGAFGAVTIDGKIWNQVALRPIIPIGKVSVALDIVFYIDQNGNIHDDEWDFSDGKKSKNSIIDKIYYIRYGKKWDPFYFQVGALDNVTLGKGILVNRFTNTILDPQMRKLGLDFNIIFANTNTSYNPDSKGRSSGRSGSDIERILAFHAIGKKDPLEYVVDWDDALEHALQVQKDWSDNNE